MPHLRIAIAIALTSTLTLGCADDPTASDGDTAAQVDADATPDAAALPPWQAHPVDGPGPFRVGFENSDVTYQARSGDGDRTLRVARWYPTEDTEGKSATYANLFPQDDILAGATPVAGPRPVLIYSHGNKGIAESSAFLLEHFASHGWLVLAPNHTGNTFLESNVERTTEIFLLRSEDLTAVLDAMAPDADTVVVAGYSFGGYTSLAFAGAAHDLTQCDAGGDGDATFCGEMTTERRARFGELADPRVDAVIAMTPANASELGPSGMGVADIDVPVLLVTAGLDITTPDEDFGDRFWANLTGTAHRRLDVATAGHLTFAITCVLLGSTSEGDGCSGDPYIPPADAWAVVNRVAMGFVRHHLFGDAAQTELLSGTIDVHPEITLQTK